MCNKTEALQSTYDLFRKDAFYWLRNNAQDKGLGKVTEINIKSKEVRCVLVLQYCLITSLKDGFYWLRHSALGRKSLRVLDKHKFLGAQRWPGLPDGTGQHAINYIYSHTSRWKIGYASLFISSFMHQSKPICPTHIFLDMWPSTGVCQYTRKYISVCGQSF